MYLTIKDVSKMLQIKPCTLYLWVAQGKIPALKIHKSIRFQREQIEAWLAECQLEPPTPSRPMDRRQHGTDHVDALIALAKAKVHTPSGKPVQDRATRKGEHRGTV